MEERIEVMKWLQKQGIPFDSTACRGSATFGQLDASVCTAAENDQLSSLMRLIENGCPSVDTATNPDIIAWLQDHKNGQ